MRLKEIKPEMAVHCRNDEEKKILLEEAERLGYVWYSTREKPTGYICTGNTVHFYDAGSTCFSCPYKHIAHSNQTGEGVIEFSDLVLPELTAEEALQTAAIICRKTTCKDCPFRDNCPHLADSDMKKVVEIIIKWKVANEKKEPEIETVDVCRIIEIQPDGYKRCVHEEDIRLDAGSPYGSEQAEEILKRYCMEHEGKFIAVHEVISRVKEAEE